MDVQRVAPWSFGASAIVVIVGCLVAVHVVPMIAFVPCLLLGTLGRRFNAGSSHADVDERGLWLDDKLAFPREQLADVWLDDDRSEARATVADDRRLLVLHFENREQARRFAEALGGGTRAEAVAGYLPRLLDALPGARFAAMAAAFFGTGSWLGVLPLAFFAHVLVAYVRAMRIVVKADGFEIHTRRGVRSYAFADVASASGDGVMLRDGRKLALSRSALRDPLMGSGAWVGRAHARALSAIGAGARRARNPGP